MKIKPLFFLSLTGVVVATGVYFRYSLLTNGGNSINETKQTVIEDPYRNYINTVGGFGVIIPKTWEVTEATPSSSFVSQTLVSPKDNTIKMGNIKSLSFTVVASSSANQILSTQKEFQDWVSRKSYPAQGSGIFKIADEIVDEVKAVRIIELSPDINFWSVTTWWRKNNLNYYANIMGNGAVTQKEQDAFTIILKKFRSIKE